MKELKGVSKWKATLYFILGCYQVGCCRVMHFRNFISGHTLKQCMLGKVVSHVVLKPATFETLEPNHLPLVY